MDPANNNPHLILPVGTKVVALVEVRGSNGAVVHPRGSVGVVIQSPADYWHAYRVRFLDDFATSFSRADIAVLSHYQEAAMAGPDVAGDRLAERDLYRHVIFRCVIGSRAYGLDGADSDTDRRGIYLPPAELHWSLYGVPEQLENLRTQETYWEAQKFVVLALKANPNVLECLYSPLVEHAAPLARDLLAMREKFLSKLVYQTYNGYVASQFKKLQADLRNHGQVKWKHVMHLLRLLMSGIGILEEGRVEVHVGEQRELLLSIRQGQWPLEKCESLRRELNERFDRALVTTALPDRPDYAAANAWLLAARRSAI